MPKFPALPASVDRYVREFLKKLVGRSGKAGDRVAMISDFTDLGLAKEKGQRLSMPASAVGSVTEILEPVNPVELPDNPVNATGLRTAGVFGAVILNWEAPVYQGHNHTEVWRAQTDDRPQASLVHEANGNRYADVTGNTVPYYYWVRHVNEAGQVGGFNALDGTLGVGTANITLNDLILEHPEITDNPFSVVNIGTEDNPNWVIAFNGSVAVAGDVSISRLTTGEFQDGVSLSIGHGSLELSQDSHGHGQIVVTGDNGIANNDYLVISEGRIESFVYTPSAGHIRYKEVRRRESGVAQSGQQVVIPAYFKSQPEVMLSPHDISIYNANYPNQSQRLELEHSDAVPHPTIEGAWVFTPYCRLLLADGSTTEAHGLSYFGSNTSQRWEMTDILDLKAVTVNGRAASTRHSGSGNTWQNRQVTMTLEYRSDGGSWISAGSTAVDINQFNTHALQLNKSLTQGTYDVAVTLSAADRSGTFTSGSLEYDYQQASKSGSGWTETLYTPHGQSSYDQTRTRNISIDSYALSGWEITRIDYSAKVAFTIKARTGYDGNWSTNRKISGEAYIEVPDGNGGVTKYRVYSGTSESGYYNEDVWNYEDSREVNVFWSDISYKDGNMRGPVKLYTSRTANTYRSFGDDRTPIATGYASATISNITATVYYRKARAQSSTASNTFYWDNSRYDLGATDISISDAIVHWTATGE